MSEPFTVMTACPEHLVYDGMEVECVDCEERAELHERIHGWQIHWCNGGSEMTLRLVHPSKVVAITDEDRGEFNVYVEWLE